MKNSTDKIDKLAKTKSCNQCEGKGYTEIRDCAGEIQRTETCSYCEGSGHLTKDDIYKL